MVGAAGAAGLAGLEPDGELVGVELNGDELLPLLPKTPLAPFWFCCICCCICCCWFTPAAPTTVLSFFRS